MNNQFKKLFDITYNEKRFTIFVDEHHRCTFLEKSKDGKYIYPTLEDYKALNKIYNEHDPFVLYNVKRYSFKEKVRIGAMLLAVSAVLLSGTVDAQEQEKTYWVVSEEEGNIVVTQKLMLNPKMVRLSLNDLESIFGISCVTIEDIDKAIENNTKLDDTFKKLAHNLAVAIYEQEPTADLRIYYLNLLNLDVECMSEEEYKDTFTNYSVACYNARENKIRYIEGCSESTLYHELAHTVCSFARAVDNIVYTHLDWCTALEEAMTNKIVTFITPTHSYSNIGLVLDYLFTFEEFNFNRYNEEGAEYILHDLFKYGNTWDINDNLNAMCDSLTNLGKFIPVEECDGLLDELFLLCKSRVNEDIVNVYDPFLDFSMLFSDNIELFDQYLKEYNAYLKERNLKVNLDLFSDKFKIYEEAKGLVWTNERLYPYVEKNNDFFTILQDERKQVIQDQSAYFFSNHPSFSLALKKAILANPDAEMDSDYWKEFAVENDIIDASYLYKTKVMFNGNILTEDYLENLKIQIGVTNEQQIGFIISNQYQEVLYKDANDLKNLSALVPLSDYYPVTLLNVENLELSTIIHLDYLEQKQELFSNLFIEDGVFQLEPLYYMYLESGEGVQLVNLNQCSLSNNEEFKVFQTRLEMPIGISLEKPIYLKDVLKFYGLLEESKTFYYFSKEEILNLVTNYLEEKDYKQVRS